MSEERTLIDELADEFSDEHEDAIARGLLSAISGALTPIDEALSALDREIEAREHKVQSLKRLRTASKRVLDTFHANADASKNGTKKQTRTGLANAVAPATLDSLEDWIKTHIGIDEDFNTQGLVDHPDWNGLLSYPTTSSGLVQLADAGAIRLDSVGPRNRRNYKRIG
jgi:hypothetical protein